MSTVKELKEQGFKETKDLQYYIFEKKGDTLQGKYKGTGHNVKFDCPHYKLDREEGTVLVMGSATLSDQFENVQVGDEVAIVYEGKETSKQGREYKVFNVLVKKGD